MANELNNEIMQLERSVDSIREGQRKILLAEIRRIQNKYNAKNGKITVVMVHDPADGYRAAVSGIEYAKRPMEASKCFLEIEQLMTDYSFVFAGVYGEATISRESEDILFET